MSATVERKWKKVESDNAFAALFVGASVVEASTNSPADAEYLGADLYWTLSDGRILAMTITDLGSGCDTCGYGGGVEKEYHSLEAPNA